MKTSEYVKQVCDSAYEIIKKGEEDLNCISMLGETYNMVLNAIDEIYAKLKHEKEEHIDYDEQEAFIEYSIALRYLLRRQVMLEEAKFGRYRRMIEKETGTMFVQLPISIAYKAQEAGIEIYEINKMKKPFVKYESFFMLDRPIKLRK